MGCYYKSDRILSWIRYVYIYIFFKEYSEFLLLFLLIATGPLFDRFSGNRIVGYSLVLTSLASLLLTFVNNLWELLAVVFFQGLSMGTLDTGGNVMILWLHESNSDPYLQSAHACFGVGSLLSPLIISATLDTPFKINIAWWAVSAFIIPIALSLLLTESPVNNTAKNRLTYTYNSREKLVIFLTALFLCLYVGAEVSAGTFLVTFAVERNITKEKEATLMNFMFWLTFTIGRIIGIPLSVYVSAKNMLLSDMAGCIVVSIVLLIFNSSRIALWIGISIFGISLATAYPSAINLAEYYLPITGRAATFIVIGSSFGEMLIPLATSSLFKVTKYLSYVYILVAAGLLGSAMLIVLLYFGDRLKKSQHHQQQNQQQQNYKSKYELTCFNEDETPDDVMVELEDNNLVLNQMKEE